MSRTLKELAQEAIDVQNACNACGVVQAFARMMIDLGPHTNGTSERNKHPIVVAYLSKLADLAEQNMMVGCDFDWSVLYRMAEGKE